MYTTDTCKLNGEICGSVGLVQKVNITCTPVFVLVQQIWSCTCAAVIMFLEWDNVYSINLYQLQNARIHL